MTRIQLLFPLLLTSLCAQARPSGPGVAEPDTCAHLSEVVVTGVTGSTRARESAAPITLISPAELRTHQSVGIVDAISRQPGVSQITTGSGISKPVIRGLGYNRVLVVNDGVRQEGQQWGDEHGIEADGQAVHSVEILKGPASLMYGSDAMAGVIILHDAPVMPEGRMHAEAATDCQTNNGLLAYSLNFRGRRKGIVWNGRWSQKWAHDYKAPLDGYVPGTRFRDRALSAMLGLNKEWGFSHLKFSYYHLTPGITEIEDSYTPGSASYTTLAPFQQVRHFKAVLDNSFTLGEGFLKLLLGYQQNRRQEYEEAQECGLDFRLHTLSYDLRYVAPQSGGWKANVGLGGMYQRSDNLGTEFLIPAYNLFDLGLFATLSRSFFDRLHLSGGLRYDHRRLHSHSLATDGQERFNAFSRRFSALSGSLGAIYNISPSLDLKANIAHGFRAPNISELASNGPHEGTFRYESGQQGLRAEHSWQFDLGLDYASKHFSAALSLFANRIGHYIYLRRDGTVPYAEEGEDPVLMPHYRFTAADARIIGGEARIILHFLRHLHFENNFSLSDARLIGGGCLPFTPPARWLATLHYDIPLRSATVRGLFAEVEADTHFRQSHIMAEGDTETPTPSYTLLNISLGTDIFLRSGRKLLTVGLTAANLTAKAYQAHLSRLKYADTFALTGRLGLNNMGRNIGLRLLFPLDF